MEEESFLEDYEHFLRLKTIDNWMSKGVQYDAKR